MNFVQRDSEFSCYTYVYPARVLGDVACGLASLGVGSW